MTWQDILKKEQGKDYYKKMMKFLDMEYKIKTIYPSKDKIFNAFKLTSLDNVKVVILGQDPYHQPNQAQGLAFSTPIEIKNPPSMINILKEIKLEFNKESNCNNGDLTPWATQGVLLINSILTVQKDMAKSHHKIGWEIFTNNIIKYLSSNHTNIIFVLWGNDAIKKQQIIDKTKHFVLTAPHPSPLSAYRGFFKCYHFSKINEILRNINKKEIIW